MGNRTKGRWILAKAASGSTRRIDAPAQLRCKAKKEQRDAMGAHDKESEAGKRKRPTRSGGEEQRREPGQEPTKGAAALA